MADKKLVEQITSREEDFAQWYTDVVKKAELTDYSSVKGFMVIRPAGYAIWENIVAALDSRFNATGVQNCSMPLLIPQSLLEKESEHVEGFAPEVAWVTSGGSKRLEERLCVRPTSEVLFCDYYSKVVKSYRDLPQLLNQWCSVVRWEKTTRPFLRTREFLWQEGHTVHATAEEAEERTLLMLDIYADVLENELAIPVVKGRKTDKEKFAGAIATYTVEALMHDGQALQCATSHNFGDGFAKAFQVQYLSKNNTVEPVHQTSWGITTRTIGALIMVHGDDSGLVLPPRIAPVQVNIIPIQQNKEGVLDKAFGLMNSLKDAGLRVKVDDSDKTPGFKFADSEVRGIPLRLEIGPKDIEAGQVVLVRRDTREKIVVSFENLVEESKKLLEQIQKDMYNRALTFQKERTTDAKSLDELVASLDKKPGFVRAMWCGCRECEEKLKEYSGITSRCIPAKQEKIADTCVVCGRPATKMVYWGRAY